MIIPEACRDEGQQADEIFKVDLKDHLPQPSDQQHSGGRVEQPNSSTEPPVVGEILSSFFMFMPFQFV